MFPLPVHLDTMYSKPGREPSGKWDWKNGHAKWGETQKPMRPEDGLSSENQVVASDQPPHLHFFVVSQTTFFIFMVY